MPRRSATLRAALATAVIGLAAPVTMLATAPAASAAPVQASSASSSVSTASAARASSGKHITIPSNYVYNPNATKQRTLHDYCTKSPDEFPNPVGANANFRGPCARHDMCIQYRQHARSTCDNNLLANMRSECAYEYGSWYEAAQRSACYKTAAVYWAVVRVKTVIS